MESKGRLKGVQVEYKTLKRLFTFEVDTCTDEETERLMECGDLRITACKWTKPKSRDANSYFWVLVGKIAKKTPNVNDTIVHDKYLSQNRFYVLDGGVQSYVITTETPSEYGIIKHWNVDEQNFNYWIFSNMGVPLTKPDGTPLIDKRTGEQLISRIYWRIKGIHEMDSRELSKVIEDVVFDANELGISTLPPKETERLLERWKPCEKIKQ